MFLPVYNIEAVWLSCYWRVHVAGADVVLVLVVGMPLVTLCLASAGSLREEPGQLVQNLQKEQRPCFVRAYAQLQRSCAELYASVVLPKH